MGSTSDIPVMHKAAEFLDKMIPLKSMHQTQNPTVSRKIRSNAHANGIRVIIAEIWVRSFTRRSAVLPFLLLACPAVRPSPLTVGIPFFPYFRCLPYSGGYSRIRCAQCRDLGSNVGYGRWYCMPKW